MILPKELPDVGEAVLIKVNKIMPHGAYCTLVEYSIDAYLPISEVASGWIKNIHEFLKDGQRDVAKAVFVDKQRRAVDVSLKKLTAKEKKDKINEFNLEKRAENFFMQAVASAHKDAQLAELKQKLALSVRDYNELLTVVYENKLPKGVLPDDVLSAFSEIVMKNVRPKVYKVSYSLAMEAVNGKGTVSALKKALVEMEKAGVEIIYEGAPHYKVTAEGPSYPAAEAKIKKAQLELQKYAEKFTIEMKNRR